MYGPWEGTNVNTSNGTGKRNLADEEGEKEKLHGKEKSGHLRRTSFDRGVNQKLGSKRSLMRNDTGDHSGGGKNDKVSFIGKTSPRDALSEDGFKIRSYS